MFTKFEKEYIKKLETKSRLKFYGTTRQELNLFIERAEKEIVERQIITNKLKREQEKFGSL